MFVAGIDAHATYSVVVVVSNTGELVQESVRIPNSEPDRLLKLLKGFSPVEAVVETSPAWPTPCSVPARHGDMNRCTARRVSSACGMSHHDDPLILIEPRSQGDLGTSPRPGRHTE